MANTITINLNDISELDDVLDKLTDFDIHSALTKSCLLVQRDARINAPKDTGQLAASIDYEVSGNAGYVGTNLSYAPYVEYGTGLFAESGDGRQDVPWCYQDAEGNWHSTSGQEPQPFLRPALNDNRSKITEIFKQQILQGIKEYDRL